MMRRPLSNRELVYVINQSDVRLDGTLRVSHKVHIARLGASTGAPIASACGVGLEPKYIYPFLTMMFRSAHNICNHCKMALRSELDGDGESFVDPASNTGAK